MKPWKIIEVPQNGGQRRIYRFDNDYGASVIHLKSDLGNGLFAPGSYGSAEGLWELGVIQFEGDRWQLLQDEDNPLGFDVEGYLDFEQINQRLEQIRLI